MHTTSELTPSPIGQFYAGRCVFITGATGFMGKVLVEKLLRSCPDIDFLYLLMRPPKDKDVGRRLQELVSSPVFDHVRSEKPDALHKLVVVSGDILSPELGLSSLDLQLLSDRISVVFHLAARIKFDDDLRSAIDSNVKGPQRVVAFCRQLKHLKAFVHVSTAFNNLDRTEILEQVYPGSIHPHKLLDLVDSMDDALLISVTKQLVGSSPNVYAFTKAIAEQLLETECARYNVPLAIVRPSIVTASIREPMAGWVDNLNGPTGLLVGVGKGLLRVVKINPNLIGDLIPVDIAVNLVIAAAWSKALDDSGLRATTVYNCASGSLNPIRWKEFERYAQATVDKYPARQMLWYPNASMRIHPLVYAIETALYHRIPAYLLDFFIRLFGYKPFLVKLYDKAHRTLSRLEFYCLREWRFSSLNPGRLFDTMSAQDRTDFNFDVRRISWPSYIETYCLGIRHYVLKEDPDSIPVARKNLKRMYWLRTVVRWLLLISILWFVCSFARYSLTRFIPFRDHESGITDTSDSADRDDTFTGEGRRCHFNDLVFPMSKNVTCPTI